MTLAALIAVACLTVLTGFQLALALGAPLGDMSWGGQHPGVLPRRLRIASAVAGLLIYPVIIAVILASAGLIETTWLSIDVPAAMWVLAGFFLLGALMNGISRSRRERIWAPVSLVVSLCCVVIAIGA